MQRRLAIPLLLFLACGGNPLPEWKTSPSPGPNAKRVDHLEKVANTWAWRRSVYSRLDDALDFPIYLIVAEDRTACIAPADDWTIAAQGDLYPCPGKWRVARLS
ncbi:MAG TPA: hypothetical protein VM716_00890 [Gemmatimonadales bacterium]|nr:hypothetical protein [Gemmatimonadales bacterium]